MKSAHTKAKKSPVRDGRKPDPKQVNQATGKEFERERLGVAPKE
jgi:hypothetical protein